MGMNREGVSDLVMYWGGPQMASPTFQAGQWYNIFVSQGPSTLSFYADGVLQQSVSKTAVAGNGVPIQAMVNSGGGAMDDLIFYSKGFSDAEVATLGGTSPQAASATGDPHLQNVHGERFDLTASGVHVLINIPRGERAENALLRVEAEARRMGESCADMYFQELNVTGAWAEKTQTGGLHFDAQSALDETPRWAEFGPVQLKISHGRTDKGVQYLNFYAKHLGHVGFVVGGLLGEDDHAEAATPSGACQRSVSLSKKGLRGQSAPTSVASVAAASFS